MKKARTAVVLSGIALIPLIYAGSLIWSNQDPLHHLDQIPAAIVNEDVPATSPATSDDGQSQEVDLGGDLVDTLTADDKNTDFAWEELDADAAAKLLASGDVLAVLTVPSDFSADAVSVAGDEPTAARLTIRTNDAANQIVGNIASTVGARVTAALSTSVSSTYLDSIYLGFSDIHSQIGDAAAGAAELSAGVDDASTGATRLADGLTDLAGGSSRVSAGASSLQSGATSAAGAGAQVATGAAGIATGIAAALDGARSLQSGAAVLSAATTGVASGAAAVNDGLQALATGYASMTDAQRLAAISQLAASSGALSAGATGVQGGATTLATATGRLVGSADAGTGLATLDAKSHELASGAEGLATGLGTLSAGATDLATGASAVSGGATDASAGAAALASGIAQLQTGSASLADGLGSGAQAIPTYTAAQADTLSAVAADPVELDAQRSNEVPATGYALAPYFMTLALWVGALAFYLMFPVLRQKLSARNLPAWRIALGSYLPGALMAVTQSLLVVVMVRFGVGIEPANLAGLAGIVLLTSLTFVAINQALIALMGPVGRFVALVLIVFQLASAGATYPIQTTPDLFQTVHSWLPFSYAVGAFRSLIAGGSIGVWPAVGVLSVWLLAALAVTTVAAGRARRRVTSAASGPVALTDDDVAGVAPVPAPPVAARRLAVS